MFFSFFTINVSVIQAVPRVIMSPTEFKMQPTIHLQSNAGYERGQYPGSLCKCIVGCIFNFMGLIITREIPCIYQILISPPYISLIFDLRFFLYLVNNNYLFISFLHVFIVFSLIIVLFAFLYFFISFLSIFFLPHSLFSIYDFVVAHYYLLLLLCFDISSSNLIFSVIFSANNFFPSIKIGSS
jgi:hypothetical protein